MYVLGVDVGTTGTKAMLLNENGEIVSRAYAGYGLIKPGKDIVEQYADDWWKTFIEAVKKCTGNINDKQDIAAISLSTQGGSLVPVDKHGQPLRNAIVWMDTRCHKQAEEVRNGYPNEFLYEKTGWGLFSGNEPLADKVDP